MISPVAAAGIYAARGWLPLPLNWVLSTGACSCLRGLECGNPGKHPRVCWKDLTSPADAATTANWWRWWPRAGVGIKTGAVSGNFVVDVDPRHGGDGSLRALEAEHGPLPADTLRVATGGGGEHIYLAHPGGEIRNDAGSRLGEGLDVRGDGGQVAAPPTLHASGRRYRWTNWPGGLAEAPDWLVAALRPPPVAPRVALVLTGRGRGYGEAALAREVERLSAAVNGDRNHQLFRSAAAVGELVGAGLLADWQAAHDLLAGAISIGLGEVESRATILSGLNKGARNPRSVSA